MDITSIILAGGQNKRMQGLPKWDLKVGNETMLERSIGKLIGISKEVLIVSGGNHRFRLEDINGRVIYDKTPYLGPLNGLMTGLANSTSEYNFVVAADMPFFSVELASYMVNLAENRDLKLIIPEWEGRLQPLHGLYSISLLESIKEDLHAGKNSLIKWIKSVDGFYPLEMSEITQFNENDRIFYNMNYPDEYRKALSWLKEEDKSE